MKDRVVQYPNRYKVTPVAGQDATYDLQAQPGTVTEPGTPLNKAALLSDETAVLYNLTGDSATVSNALKTNAYTAKNSITGDIPEIAVENTLAIQNMDIDDFNLFSPTQPTRLTFREEYRSVEIEIITTSVNYASNHRFIGINIMKNGILHTKLTVHGLEMSGSEFTFYGKAVLTNLKAGDFLNFDAKKINGSGYGEVKCKNSKIIVRCIKK